MKVLTILSSAVRVNILKFLVLFSILFGGISGNVFALTTAHTYSGTVCADGALTMGAVLSGASPGIPGGHQTGGTWKAITPGLVFSSLTDPNASVTGLAVSPPSTVVQWTHKSGHVYTITFTVTALGTMPSVSIDVNGGPSVILCGTNNVNINASVINGQPGTFGQSYYYYINGTLAKANTYLNNTVHLTDTYTDNSYAIKTPPVDNAYVIYTDKSGCQVKSNLVSISDNSVSLKIQNNNSACDPTILNSGKELEVLPYDNTFAYTWTPPSGVPVLGINKFTITTAGTYTVSASKVGCTAGPTSVIISGAVPFLAPNIQGPTAICATAAVVTPITLSTTPAVPAAYKWYWYKDGSLTASSGTTNVSQPTHSASLPGSYVVSLKQELNELCYINTAAYDVNPVLVDQNITFSQNCNTATIDWDFPASGNGKPPYDVIISPSPAIAGIGTFNNLTNASPSTNFTLTSNNNITVTSVVDDNACPSDPLNFPAATPLTYYPTPLPRTVLGNNVCFGSTMGIGVQLAQSGVTYKLYNQANLTVALASALGTGSDISFAPQPTAVGTYVVKASVAGCATEIDMAPTFQIYPSPTVFTMGGPGGTLCSSATHTFSLSGSEIGVTYRLLRDGGGVASLPGTGGILVFPDQFMAGTYTVVADRLSCTSIPMNGSRSINQAPIQYSITGNGVVGATGCQSSGLNIALTGNEIDVFYTLYLNGASIATSNGNSNFGLRTAPGDYIITGVKNSCTVTMNQKVTIFANPLPQTFQNFGIKCPQANIGLTNTELGVTYQVYKDVVLLVGSSFTGNGGPMLNQSTASAPGEYTIIASSSGCSTLLSQSLTIQAQPTTSLPMSVNKTSYCSAPNTGVTLTVLNSELNVTYELYKNNIPTANKLPGNGGPLNWNNLDAGVYDVWATNVGGCNVRMTDGPFTIVNSSPPTSLISAPATNFTCDGSGASFNLRVDFTGVAPWSFTLNGGVAPVNITTSNNPYIHPVTPTITTTYTITGLQDAASCNASLSTNTGSATITVHPIPNVSITSPSSVCVNSSITLSADFNNISNLGTTYLWSTSDITKAITSTPVIDPSNYSVTVTSAFGCSGTANKSVQVKSLPNVTLTDPTINNYIYCQNDAAVALKGSPLGITGSFSSVPAGAVTSGGTFNPSIANTTNGSTVISPVTYTYTDPASGCTNSQTKDFTVHPVANVSIINLASTYCANAGAVTFRVLPAQNPNPNGKITVDGMASPPAAPNDYWRDNNDGTGILDVTKALAYLGPGTRSISYTYTTPNGCVSVVSQNVLIQPDFNTTLNFLGLPSNPCQSDNTAYLLTARTGGVVITNGVVFSGPGVSATAPYTFTPSAAGNGTHSIRLDYTDPINGCSGNTSQNVTVGSVLTIPSFNPFYCQSAPSFPIVGAVDGTSPGGGKVELFEGTVAVPLTGVPIATDPNDAIALDGSVVFDPAVAPTGDYFIKYTFTAAGCTNTRTFEFKLVTTPDATFTTKVGVVTGITNFCASVTNVDLVPTTAGGNFTGPGVTGLKFNPSAAGVPGPKTIRYTLTSSSSSTCSDFKEMVVTVNPLPNYSITTLNAKYCDNDANNFIAINGAVNGVPRTDSKYVSSTNGLGTHFLVSDEIGGDGIVEIQPEVVGVGAYTVTFSDKDLVSGCSNSVSVSTNVVQSDLVNVGGFNAKYEYCKGDAPFNVTASFVTTGLPVGAGGIFTASDALDSQWLTGLPNTGVATIDPSKASVGTHDITFTYINSNSCTTSVKKVFTILDNPTVYNVGGGGNYCTIGGTGLPITLSGSQNAGYTYELLLNGAQIGVTMLGTGAPLVFPLQTAIGTYTITSTNNVTKCVSAMSGSATVVQNNPDFNTTITPIKCKGGTGSIQIDVATPAPGYGATPPYQYSIDGAPWVTSNIFTALTANTYAFRVKDALNCTTVSKDVTLTEPAAALSVGHSVSPNVGCDLAPYEGGTTLTISGGTPFATGKPDGYDIKWYNSANVLQATFTDKITISNLNIDTYRYDVLDAQGCTVTGSFDVDPKPALTLIIDPDVTKHKDNNCSGGFAGEFAVIASGGSGKYQFSLDGFNWFPAGGTAALVFPATTYTHTFTNLEGAAVTGKSYIAQVRDYDSPRCDAQAPSVSIFSPATLTLTGDVTKEITCYNVPNGEITLTATGGKSGTYNYKLDAASLYQGGSNVYSGLVAGLYNIAVQDAAYTTCPPAYLTTPITLTNPVQISAVASVVKNVKCFGGNEGEVTVSTNGGTGTLSYNWYNVATPATSVSNTNAATGLIAGTYRVDITDAKLCPFQSNTVVITEPTAIITSFPVIIPAACNLATEGGSATVNATGGTTPYKIKWSTLETGSTISNLVPGIYGVVVTDDNQCTASNSVNIGSYAPVAVAEDVTVGKHIDVLCHGASTGKFTVIGSGGSGDYEFSIDNKVSWAPDVADSYTYTNLLADTYEVFVRDRNHPLCVSSTGLSVTISEPQALGLDTVSTSDATCHGASNGVITVQGTGGSGLYNYSLDPNPITPIYGAANSWNNLSAGAHSVWVQDVNAPGCIYQGMAGVTISQPPAVSFTTSTTNPTCNGATDGTITVTAVGGSGVANLLYSNDNGSTYQVPNVFNGLSGAVPYAIVVRDKSSLVTCATSSQSVTLINPPLITATEALASHINVACFGAATGSFTVVPVPASASLEYSIDNGITWQTSPVFSGLIEGFYSVSVQKHGAVNQCKASNVFTVHITEPTQGFNIVPGIGNDVSCPSGKDGTVAITIGGGRPVAVTDLYDMTWVGPLGSGFVSPPGNVGALATQTGLWKAGNYKATVTDGAGCVDTLSILLKSPAPWSVTTAAPIPVSVSGGSDGKFTITSITGSTSPYTLRWYDEFDVLYPAGNDLWSFGGLRAGNDQYVVITGAAPTSCKDTVKFNISEPGPLDVDPPTFTNVKCYGDNTGSILINITSGQPNYTFHILGNPVHNAPFVKDSIQASSTMLYDKLGAGVYNISVTDGAGQTWSSIPPITISEPQQFQMVVDVANVSDIACHGGNTGAVGVKIISAIPSGTTDGYPLVWTRPNGLFTPGTVGTVSALTALTDSGTYIAHVEQSITGCTVPDISIKVREADEIVVTTTQNDSVTCFGGNDGIITVKVSGRPAGTPYAYSWSSSDPLFVPSNSPTITNLRAGWYRVTVTAPAPDLCPVTPADIWVGERPQLVAITTPKDIITCMGDNTGELNIEVTGGKPNYTLNIGSGAPSNGAFSVTGLSAGTYSYTVTDAANCKLVVSNNVITEPAALVVSNIVHTADCILPTSGALSFDLLGGLNKDGFGFNQYNITLSNLEGTFSFANTITSPLIGTALAGISPSFINLPMGHYTLVVSDNYADGSVNCPNFRYDFVLENIVITGTPSDALCKGINTGAITGVTIAGASAIHTYSWSSLNGTGLDNSTLNQAGLSAGLYTLTVTDTDPKRNCTVSANFTVDTAKTLVIHGAASGLRCYDSQNGSIIINNVSSAQLPFSDYRWNGPNTVNVTSPNLTNLFAGDYKLEVVDALGCSAIRSFKVEPATAISYTLATTLDNCSPYERSIVMSSLTGGTGSGPIPVYTFTWSGPQSGLPSTADLHNLNIGGLYSVTVKDENLCEVTTPITISGPMKVAESITQLACKGDANGAIGITLTGGTGPFTYTWSSLVPGFVNPGTKDLSGLEEGNYHLNVVDNGEIGIFPPLGSNCQLDADFAITAPTTIVINVSKSDIVCAGKNMGAIHLTVSGGTAPYKVIWPSGYGSLFTPGNYVLDQDSLPAGTYLIEVEDFNKCKNNITVEILDQAPLAFTLTKNDTNCNGIGGDLTVSPVTGGVAPFQYAWGGPSITATNPTAVLPTFASNLSGGAYAVTVTDANGCKLTKTDTLTSILTVNHTQANESCQGQFNGAINLSVSGGSGNYTYSWSGSNGGLVLAGDQTKQDLGGLCAGTYTVVVTDTRPSPSTVVCTTTKVINLSRNHTLTLPKINSKSIYCFGANDGYIAIEVAGGSGNYKYTWSGPVGYTVAPSKDSIYNCKSGSHTITIEDLTIGCELDSTIVLTGPTAPLLLTVDDSTNVKCVGDASGTIDVLVTGGTQFAASPFYKYNWSGPGTLVQDLPTQINLLAGDYQVSAVDANGCSTPSRTIKILEPPVKLKVSLDALVHVSAFGGNNGDIKVKVVGGVGSYSLDWTGLLYDNITPINHPPLFDDLAHQSNLQSGHYNVLVTDGDNCTSSLNNIFISQPGGALMLTASATDVARCKGDSSGVVNADVYGGKLPYSIIWKSGPTTIGANGAGGESSLSIGSLAVGAYTVEVRDDNGNFATQSVNISEPPALLLSANATPISCYLDATGSIQVILSGGKPNASSQYKLQVSGTTLVPDQLVTAGVVNIPALRAGKYLIKLTDDSKADGVFDQFDCSKSVTVDVLEPKASVVISDNSTVCAGNKGVIKLIASNWSFPTPLTVQLSDGTTYNLTSSPLFIDKYPTSTTTYTITNVSDGVACNKGVFSGSATITVNANPTANIHNNSTICLGEVAQVVVDFTGKAPFTYTYYESASATSTTAILPANVYVATINASPMSTSTYTVTSISDANGCSSVAPSTLLTGSALISVNPLPTATLQSDTVICEGTNANLRFKVTNGTALWTVTYSATDTINGTPNTVTVSKSVTASGNLIVPVTPTRTTTYNLLSVKDANGCEQSIGSQKVVVTVNPRPALVGAIVGPSTVCQGARLVTYTIPKVDNALSYVWKVPSGDTIVSGQGTRTIIVNFPINAKDSLISVTASNLCTSEQASLLVTTTDLLTVPNAPTGPTAPLCQGAKGLVYKVSDVFGATGYKWHLPAGFSITPLTSTTSSTISVDLDPAIATMSGFISVSAVNDCGAGASSPKLAVAINANPIATNTAGIDVDLCNTSTNLNATLPINTTGKWDILSGTAIIPVGSFANPNTSVSNLSPDENRFRWTITSAAGCAVSDEVSIFNNMVPVNASSDKGTTCDGTANLTGTTLVTSGPDQTTGQWSYTTASANFANGTSSTTAVSGLNPGLNSLVWTITKKGCPSPSSPVNIINNTPNTPVIQGSANIDLCATSVTLTASPAGGVWSVASGQGTIVGPNNVATVQIANLGKGDNIIRYTVTNGSCTLYDEVTVRNNMLDVNAGNDQTVCDGKANLVGNAIPATAAAGTVGFWTIAPSSGQVFSNANSNSTSISNLAVDNNTIKWNINQRGCISSDSLVATNNQATPAVVGGTISVCGETAVLTGNTPLNGSSGMWSPMIGSGDFDNKYLPTTKVDNVGMGENTYRWTITKFACTSSVLLKVINLKIPVNAGLDTAICDKTTRLHATPTANGEWTIVPGFGSGTFEDRNSANTRVGGLGDNANTFIWNVTSNGCLSKDSVTVVVNAPSTSDAGANYSTTGTTYQLQAVWPPYGTGIGHWELVEGGATIANPDDAKSQVSNLRKGSNIFRWVVEKNGCSSSSDVTITNKATVPVSAGTDTKICDSKITLLGSDPDVGIGEWTVVGKGTIANPYSPITKVTEIGPGINKFIWTVYFTSSTVSDTVVITNNQTPVPNAGSERVVCADTFKLEGNQAVVEEIKWSVLSGKGEFDDPSDPTTVVRKLGQGVNLFKYMFRIDDCISFDTVRIINNLPTTANAGPDEVICTDSYELRPNTPTYGTAEWAIIQGDATFNGNKVTKLGANVVNILEYRITNGTCTSTDRINITNSSASKADAGSDRNVCEDTVVLSANVPQYFTEHYWERLSGSGVFRTHTTNVTVVDSLGSGRSRYRWVIKNGGCTSVDDVEIANNYLQANAGSDRTICTDTLSISANNASPGVGSWGVKGGSGKAQFDNPSAASTIVRTLDQGTNIITWTILNVGCVSVSEIKLVNDSPTKADAGVNQAVCDSFVILSGNKPSGVGGTATWTPISGSSDIDDASSSFTRVDGLVFGSNIYRWSIVKNSCVSYDDVEVSYNTVYAAVGDSQTLCSNTAILAAESPLPGIGTWSVFGTSSQATFVDVFDPNTTVTNLGRGKNVLRWSVAHKGCTTNADVIITNDLPSDAYAGNTQEICTSTTTLDASDISTGIGTGTWTVITGKASITNPDQFNSEVTTLSQGDNVLQWSVVNNLCTLTDEVLIRNNTPSEPYAGADFESCSNTITLKAAAPAYGKGTWSVVEPSKGNIASYNSPETEVTNLKADVNVFKWEIVSGNCRVEDFVTVTNNTPTKANAGPDIHDCKDNAVLDANIDVEGDGKWTIVTGSADIADVTDPKTKVTGLGFGDNSLQWTISKGATCFSSDIVMVFNKVPDQSKAGIDQVVCDNYTTLNANDPTSGKGTWLVMSGLGEFEDRNNYQSKVNNIGFGENVYKWTIEYGTCSTFDLVAVQSNKAYADAGADDVTYTGSIELAANKEDNTPGSWEVLAGQGTFVDANNFNTVVSGLRSGVNTFRWIINVDNCVAFDDVSINYKVVPDADFIASSNDGCSPLTVKFTNYTVGRDSTFYWDFDDGSSSTLRHPTHTFVDPGVYTVSLTAQGPDGNNAESIMVITVRPHPVSDFSATPEVVYVPGDQVRFYNFSVDAVEYMWYFGHDNDISTERNPIYEYPETGVYSVALAVKNIYNCTDSITKTDFITAKQQGFIIFPNAFTPRGDSNTSGGISSTDKNAIFRPISKFVDVYELQIFNQWGQMVYSSSNIDEGWNGEYKGEIVPQGVYVWKVTGRFLSGKGFNDVGNVMVVR